MISNQSAPSDPAIDDVVLAIHGILANSTSPTWPERLANNWAARPGNKRLTITSRYYELPLPRLAWLRNRRRTKRLHTILEHLAAQLSRHGSQQPRRLHLVGHSNGCLIALQLALKLAAQPNSPWRLGTIALIAPALPAGPTTRKIATLIDNGDLEHATLYRCAHDRALGITDIIGPILSWPWGSLGKHGWCIDHAMSPMRGMSTRDFERGHNGYFAQRGHEANYEDLAAERATFELLSIDLDEPIDQFLRRETQSHSNHGTTASADTDALASHHSYPPIHPFPDDNI